jgi:hypothetical protein
MKLLESGVGERSQDAWASLSRQMDDAIENYLNLSPMLLADVDELLDLNKDSQPWRRNFIRASAALIEGYVHGLREICVIRLAMPKDDLKLSSRDKKALIDEESCSARQRLKSSIRAVHSCLELGAAPLFTGNGWINAVAFLDKRNYLMHPKNSADLDVPDKEWALLYQGVAWIFEQLFLVFDLIQRKYCK